MRKWFRRFLKAALGIAVIAIITVVILLTAMWREHKTPTSLPQPTGQFSVGRTTFSWTNGAQDDDPHRSPELVVWMWYPTSPFTGTAVTEYLPSGWRKAIAEQQGKFMRSFLKRDPSVVRVHALPDPPVSSEQANYPVVLLRAGGSALTTDFTTLAENLASHGYFVVGFDAPYRSFVVVLRDGSIVRRLPQYNIENANGNLDDPLIGKLLTMWTSDTKFVVDQLQHLNRDPSSKFGGHLDLAHIGMFGHSFGGATALQFCHEDSRCKAAIDVDGIPFGSVVREGLTKPCMFILSDHSREMADPSSQQVRGEIQSIYDRLPAGRHYVVIRTANHFSFSDQILLNSQIAIKLLRRVGFGGLDGRRGLAISADYIQTFFDVYLKEAPDASLMSLSEKYPEVQLGSSPQR